MSGQRAPSSALTSFVVASRYVPVYIALFLLIIVAAIWAPATLSRVALRAIAPYGAVLGITALGQMLVIMTGGIDLSVPGTMSLAAVIMVGVGDGSNENVGGAIAIAMAVAAVIGLVNGILIGGLKLNALITTLAVGLIVIGVVNRYGSTFAVQSPVPTGLSDWTSTRVLGVSPVFWIGVGLTTILIAGLRYTAVGRRFQAVGANPVASHVVGVRVNLHQIVVYVVAAIFYAIAGVALAGLRWRLFDRGSGQPVVHVRGRSVPHGSQSDAANDGAPHLAPVRGVRSRHHRGDARFGRSDHPRRRAGAA